MLENAHNTHKNLNILINRQENTDNVVTQKLIRGQFALISKLESPYGN